MEEMRKKSLQSYFEAIEDPRVERTKQHKLLDIIIIALCGKTLRRTSWTRPGKGGGHRRCARRTARRQSVSRCNVLSHPSRHQYGRLSRAGLAHDGMLVGAPVPLRY